MAGLENRIMQLEMLNKQQETKINAQAAEIERLQQLVRDVGDPVCTSTTDETPDPVAEKPKREAPRKQCIHCNAMVYTMWHKRHEAECTEENPSTKGVVKDV